MAQKQKDIDICLFGASGFTGSLVAKYLSVHADITDLKWAIAGRNKQKLERLQSELLAQGCSNSPQILVGDVANYDSLGEIAAQCKVMITTVGPYTHYGEPLLKACVEKHCDYVDLVGEPNFVDLMRYRYHEEAKIAGVKIINACGFDSIPHDLGVLHCLNLLKARFPQEQQKYLQIDMEGFVATNARFSGGTWHSAITAMSKMVSHQALKRIWRQEGYYGNEAMKPGRIVKAKIALPHYRKAFSQWAMPMPTIDPEIVVRSAQIRDDYGLRFAYRHYLLMEKWWQIPALAFGAVVAFCLAQFRWGRARLGQVLSPGEGPTEERRSQSWFKVDFVATACGETQLSRVSGGDPGYSETSKMLAESALCLALQRDKTPDVFGVTTPAASMGEILIERLQSADIVFEAVHE